MAGAITLKRMHTVYIGMGANLPSPAGPPAETLAAAAARIATLGQIKEVSSLYSTEPVGYSEQPKFVNAVLALETVLSAQELLHALLETERAFGRDRTGAIVNGPRTLDLDILLFEDHVIDEPGLSVPHPRLAERAFVLVPLSEIAPDAINPRNRKAVSEMLRNLVASFGDTMHAAVKIRSDAWDCFAGQITAGK